MYKYDYNKINEWLERKGYTIGELMNKPEMFGWNPNTIKEILSGKRGVSERFAKAISKCTGVLITDIFTDEYISTMQTIYSKEKLKHYMTVNKISTIELGLKLQMKKEEIWDILEGKKVFSETIANKISKLYNLNKDYFCENNDSNTCYFLSAEKDDNCIILTETDCVECPFFKTKDQYYSGRKEAKQKLVAGGKWNYYIERYPILKGV